MKIVDLFSGAGGLTFGFYYKLLNGKFVVNEDCNIIFANEYDKDAAKAFQLNFPDVRMINKDIRTLSKREIEEYIGKQEIDLIIGGPPCQSYSTIGKRKYDDKAKLYEEYYRLLSIIKPKMFLFENVTGMLSMKSDTGTKVIDDIKSKFKSVNYEIDFEVLDAAEYGVPQHRQRVFIIGRRSDLHILWDFKDIKKNNFTLSIKDAIDDLPSVSAGTNVTTYKKYSNLTSYQKLMRNPSGNLTCHFSPIYGDKIQTIINNVIQGEGKNYINKLVCEGKLSEKYKITSGYNNCYGRLLENVPCTTITNNVSTPSGLRCIHYRENRALTPREGARIQSFPDWFQFVGSKKAITTQIGNAVPPLLAIKIANQIEKILKDT